VLLYWMKYAAGDLQEQRHEKRLLAKLIDERFAFNNS
jgi:hypothetical protein